MRRSSAERITKHEERSNHHHRRHRRCCATGCHSHAGEGPLEEGCQPEEGRAQGPEERQGQAAGSHAEEGVKPNKKAVKPAHAKKTATPRADSKGSKILALIGRFKGASLAEIMEATHWQAHSVRGFLSTVSKKRGLKIDSTKTEAGERTYRIAK